MKLADLVSNSTAAGDGSLPALMSAKIIDLDPLRVLAPALDGGKRALALRGTLPTYAAELAAGDSAWIMLDETGAAVLVAAEPTGAAP